MHETFVIAGAGHVGGRAAQALREAGWRGAIVLVGDEAEAPYERPPLSKGVLLGEPFAATLRPAVAYADDGIELLCGRRVVAIERAARLVRLDDARAVPYRALLLATGGRPRRLDVPGADLPGIHMLRTLADARALEAGLRPGARWVVVGGGFIGLEVAAAARARGAQVVVLEAAPRLLGRGVTASIAARVHALHEARGVRLRLGVLPVGFERDDRGLRVRLGDGSVLEADRVVVGIGIVPNTELAERAGLTVDNGIVVDAGLRSSDPNIYAAGDVARFPSAASGAPVRLESWHNAEQQARCAARNMCGAAEVCSEPPWFWSDQYDHQLQVAGEPALGASCVTRALDGGELNFHLDAAGRLVGASGFGPTGAVAKDLKLARMLVERHALVAPALLADPAVKLKPLLAGERAGG